MNRQHTVKIKTTGTSNRETVNFALPHGFVGRVAAFAEGLNGTTVELGLFDDSNVEILPITPIENWKQRNGGDYLNSMKPLQLETLGRNYSLVATNDSGNFEADKTIKVTFIYI